jgi:hypothetical protein
MQAWFDDNTELHVGIATPALPVANRSFVGQIGELKFGSRTKNDAFTGSVNLVVNSPKLEKFTEPTA